ncbi:MAG: RimK family alpha-L-glutamate ligase [Clostridiales Family XIII bacterium]|jgi:RimK family alpha-L-glutamate ligase|nr:RimK family alpha-L-glutamate ligase [Clostridiales Family XIII bacterium]
MKGWLVANHFIATKKFVEINELLLKAAAKAGVELELKTNLELARDMAMEGLPREGAPDFALFWDKDVRLGRLLELKGLRLFNSARGVEVCDDKSLTYLELMGSGLAMPKTMLVPKLFHPEDWAGHREFLEGAGAALGFPLVAKECYGSFGEQVYLASSEEELRGILNRAGTRPMILQEFISSSAGRDVRINVVGGEPAAAMYRYSASGDFRANLTNGGLMKAWTPDAAQLEMAVRATEALGLDYAGVDILFGRDGEPILCEVNSNAHFKNIYECTGVNTAELIIRHVAAAVKS